MLIKSVLNCRASQVYNGELVTKLYNLFIYVTGCVDSVCESVLLLQNVVRGDGICPTAHLRVILPAPIDQNMPPPPFHDISKFNANVDLSLYRATSSSFPLPDNTVTKLKEWNIHCGLFVFALFH